MTSLATRITRALSAGLRAVLRSLLLVALVLGLGIPVGRAGLQWYATGRLDPLPGATQSSGTRRATPVIGATPAEATAISGAVGRLRYRLPGGAVTFTVTDVVPCPQCAGEYFPAESLIRIKRSVVHIGGPYLDHAVAHEIGHYVDQHFLSGPARERFKKIRDIPPTTNWVSPDKPWQDRPEEDFAEVFAILAAPSAVLPPQTSYGPVRDSTAIGSLLADAGVRFDRTARAPDWKQTLASEYDFLWSLTSSPTGQLALLAIAAAYLLLDVLPEIARAWRIEP